MDCAGYLMKGWMLADARLLMGLSTKMLGAMEGAQSWPGFERRWRVTEMEIWRWRQEPCRHLVAWAMEPGYERLMLRTYRMLTERRLAAAALAIRLSVLEHDGELPVSLVDLIPVYLPTAVEDPMASDGKSIGYVLDKMEPKIYSVGENGKDDSGSQEPTRDGRNISRWERADVVVHLTRKLRKNE